MLLDDSVLVDLSWNRFSEVGSFVSKGFEGNFTGQDLRVALVVVIVIMFVSFFLFLPGLEILLVFSSSITIVMSPVRSVDGQPSSFQVLPLHYFMRSSQNKGPFWLQIILRHLIFRVPKKGP